MTRSSIWNGSGADGVEHLERVATTSTSPVGRSGLTLRSSRAVDLADDLDDVLVAQVVRGPVEHLVADDDLGDAGGVAQVDEGHAAVIAPPRHPPGEGDGLAGVVGTQGAGLVGAEHRWSFESGCGTSADAGGAPAAASRRSLRTGPVYGGRAAGPNGLPLRHRAGSRQSSLPDGSAITRHVQLAPAGVERAAPRSTTRAATASASSSRSSRRSRCSRFLAPGALGAGCGQSSSSTPRPDGWRSAAGIADDTGCHPDSSAQKAASRAGSALSSGSAAIGPGGVLGALLHDAERVALGVGEHHPRHVALADVEVACARARAPAAPPPPDGPRR